MAVVNVDISCLLTVLRWTSSLPCWLTWSKPRRPLSTVLHSSDDVDELS